MRVEILVEVEEVKVTRLVWREMSSVTEGERLTLLLSNNRGGDLRQMRGNKHVSKAGSLARLFGGVPVICISQR